MAKITYQDKEYDSKSELIVELFNSGKLKNDNFSKSQLIKETGISIQTIDLVLDKIIEECSDKVKSIGKRGKITEVIIVRSGEEVEGRKIKVSFAPNKWGLPITLPPIYVIDDSYKGDDYISPDDSLNTTNELIKY